MEVFIRAYFSFTLPLDKFVFWLVCALRSPTGLNAAPNSYAYMFSQSSFPLKALPQGIATSIILQHVFFPYVSSISLACCAGDLVFIGHGFSIKNSTEQNSSDIL